MHPVHFLSRTEEWETPQWLFDKLDQKFHFELDVCATPGNAKCPKFLTKTEDGLKSAWLNVNWMNPPYGRQIGKWIEKAFIEATKGKTTVALLPARTDTNWFHSYIYHKHNIEFLKGRLKFGQSKNPAPFPSMIVTFN